ncbi:TPA: 4-hydroxy-tetrahydrodipicolinate synthase [Streptococcus suis]|uniref:4-hydroxy-tetrahydrodipicolinate synthase n=2 Tax=Streptococcus suis TaxID=1307 RepID=A0A116LSZ6_STRSU|nr:4-hydroxy-tetrahydrodipicolinate synthase [Streptococcus suis]MCK3889506.1 4-hydroxy-tetrahydrodipicolinate synthase [Streptococcus suis]MCQ8271406.1 4-hydroxy-tetrahydrodipicolinate synthase [Streptococcus suis]MCQ8785504.1 4-hydroxy-tetrahydrodipicolinate synthase [Streptococcus suis]MDW8731695.1 4-hydroxy-tetrahydrodipicolinate synthase [Streptococcus suis]MDY7601364.1 4-hydroxy-tetrahydrodipicolinate synthase [Streptococcus suis]
MSIQDLRDVKIITAMITPFKEDGAINYDVLPELVEHLLAHHTEGILLAGTTAESPTLTHAEELELFAAVQKIVNGRVPLIAGIGTNDTRDSIEFAKEVAAFGGFAAGLAIVPYYNKPSQEGMYQHFKAIADASDLPIIIYNIPGRVVVEMTPETMLRLAEHPNIIGVKECTSLANMAYLIEHKPEDFLIYTGEDGDAFHAMNLGADGVISVASHTNGDEMYEMFTAIEQQDIRTAAAIQRKFIPKVNALFSYPSPAPVKAVLNYMGFEVGPLRLPLVPCPEEDAKRIIKVVVDGDYEATKATVTGVVRPDY